jgi:hypothetical protein
MRNRYHPLATVTDQSGASSMKGTFTASVTREDDWYVAQCLEVDVARQGDTEEEALLNLREAIARRFTPPVATALPDLRPVEVEIGAAETATVSGSQAQARGGRLRRSWHRYVRGDRPPCRSEEGGAELATPTADSRQLPFAPGANISTRLRP